jgi:putative transposase
VFRFVERERANYPVATMCRVLGVSTSGYYAWRSRPASPRSLADAVLTQTITTIHRESRGTYGAPRIHADLRLDHRIFCGQKRVARLMRQAGIAGVHRRRRIKTTRPQKTVAPAPDLLSRDFGATAPDQKWVADITYVPTWSGFMYLAVVLDCFSRRVVGWCMRDDLTTQLVLDALEMAIANRHPGSGLIHHSDRGCQYTSYVFGRRCKDAGIVPSMGSVGDAYDNAAAESFFATLECELIDRSTFRNRTEAVWPSSTSSRSSTTGSGGTLRSACSRRPSSKGCIVRPRSPETDSYCPAPLVPAAVRKRLSVALSGSFSTGRPRSTSRSGALAPERPTTGS